MQRRLILTWMLVVFVAASKHTHRSLPRFPRRKGLTLLFWPEVQGMNEMELIQPSGDRADC